MAQILISILGRRALRPIVTVSLVVALVEFAGLASVAQTLSVQAEGEIVTADVVVEAATVTTAGTIERPIVLSRQRLTSQLRQGQFHLEAETLEFAGETRARRGNRAPGRRNVFDGTFDSLQVLRPDGKREPMPLLNRPQANGPDKIPLPPATGLLLPATAAARRRAISARMPTPGGRVDNMARYLSRHRDIVIETLVDDRLGFVREVNEFRASELVSKTVFEYDSLADGRWFVSESTSEHVSSLPDRRVVIRTHYANVSAFKGELR